ncbi:MAG: hypothetical protein WCJ56_01420 [bacterium]
MRYCIALFAVLFALASYAQVDVFTTVNHADYAFTGTVDVVKANRGGFVQVSFGDVQSLDGREIKDTIYAIRPPVYDANIIATNKNVIVVLETDAAGDVSLTHIFPGTPENVTAAKRAISLPIGWSIKLGMAQCPWDTWATEKKVEEEVCDKCGRPAHGTIPAGLTMTVETIMPDVVLPTENPSGDGLFRLNIVNNGKTEVAVPELWTDGKAIYWDASLVTIYQDNVALLPTKVATAGWKEVKLQPGEGVSGLINALTLTNVTWPRGDVPKPVNFKFAVGRLAVVVPFVYSPKRHDAMHVPALVKTDIGVQPKAGTTATMSQSGNASTIDIRCPRGIGGMSITAADGKWPAMLTLRLQLKGLENFTLKSDVGTITAEVNSGTHVVMQHIALANQAEPQAESSLKIHATGDIFDVTLPAEFLKGMKEVTISWIDFYR